MSGAFFYIKKNRRHTSAENTKEKPHTSAHSGRTIRHDIQGLLVGTTELESVTSCMSSKRSNQLSYAPVNNAYHTKNSCVCQAFCAGFLWNFSYFTIKKDA